MESTSPGFLRSVNFYFTDVSEPSHIIFARSVFILPTSRNRHSSSFSEGKKFFFHLYYMRKRDFYQEPMWQILKKRMIAIQLQKHSAACRYHYPSGAARSLPVLIFSPAPWLSLHLRQLIESAAPAAAFLLLIV